MRIISTKRIEAKPVGRRRDQSRIFSPRLELAGRVLAGFAVGDVVDIARHGERIVITPHRDGTE